MTALSTTTADTVGAISAVLELARWAPSGDNTQPWRFEILGPHHAALHGHDTRGHCVYDLDGWASQVSLGTLMETIAISASAHGLTVQALRRTASPDTRPVWDLHFSPAPGLVASPLLDAVPLRSVQRRPYATTAVSADQRQALQDSLGAGFELRWIDGWAGRARMARLLFRSARLRLTTPEAYRVHSEVIDWGRRFSEDKVPDQALGVPGPMLGMMKYAMHSWERVQFFNRWLAGTWSPRLQMDLWPAMACGAHFVLLARQAPAGMEDHVQGGRAVQRFWLTATALGLSLQPELTPLIFARYAAQKRRFSVVEGSFDAAQRVATDLARIAGNGIDTRGVFMGRIGVGPPVLSRSLRRPLHSLLMTPPPPHADTHAHTVTTTLLADEPAAQAAERTPA